MPHDVKVADGQLVTLPNGKAYQNGETVRLTDIQFGQIAQSVLDAEVVTDVGIIGDEGGGGEGVGFDFVTLDGSQPASATEFQTLLAMMPGVAAFEPWQANIQYQPGMIIEPTVRNNHAYRTLAGGTSGADEPEFPTDGSDVADNDITWTDFDTVDDFGAPDPTCNIFVWVNGAWRLAFSGAWASSGAGFSGTRLSNSGTIFNTGISGTDTEVTKYTFENGTIHFEQHDLFGTLINQVRIDSDQFAIAGSGGDVIKVIGAKALGLFGHNPAEATDRPVIPDQVATVDVDDFNTMKAWFESVGLLDS